MLPFRFPNTSQQPGGSTMLDRVIDAVKATFDSLSSAVTNEKLVNARIDGVNPTKVYHGLGHVPKAWELVDCTGNATVFRSAPMTDKYVQLNSSALTDVVVRFS